MAKPKTDPRLRLAQLSAERAMLEDRKIAIERTLTAPDLSNLAGARERGAKLQAELAGIAGMLPALAAEISRAGAAVREVEDQETLRSLTDLRAKEQEAYGVVVKATLAMRDALESLRRVYLLIATHGAAPRMALPRDTWEGMATAMEYLHVNYPELIGLPAKRSPKEQHQLDAYTDCEHILHLWNEAKAGEEQGRTPEVRRAFKKRREEQLEQALEFAQRRCRDAGIDPPPGGPGLAAIAERARRALLGVQYHERIRERYGPYEDAGGGVDVEAQPSAEGPLDKAFDRAASQRQKEA